MSTNRVVNDTEPRESLPPRFTSGDGAIVDAASQSDLSSSKPTKLAGGEPPQNEPPALNVAAAFDHLIRAAHAYHRHTAIEKCLGCSQCTAYRDRYYAAHDQYTDAIKEMIG